ncbi:DUF4236 domain-containing protein [Halomonas sp. LR5S13]|uniref:DUF4236 domain-containing protein n=1 Tax=Halomonas rhizosphaerae TaxID=3043296 RepID=UPI0024A7A713|nr:DUF4236 domain-containing protein [Halomonas rhizosphaerae]MDI5920189.1 DUF4236 domain-containing protein [Halomonas rhizosphaerae]
MGFRFQRRIRLAPGARLITCRLRPGLSVGPPGIRLQLASGEGGEGLPVYLDIAANGEIRYRHPDGRRLPDAEARALRRHGEAAIRAALASHCEQLNADLDSLECLHEQTPPSGAAGYQPRSYPVSPPTPVTPEQPDWRHALWPAARARLERENARREASHAQAYRAWEWEKAEFDAREFERQQREEVAAWDDPEAMQQTLAERLEELGWPRETLVDFELSDDCRTIALDIDLPGEEELPDRYWTMPAKRLKLSPRKLGATRQRELYRRHVHGVAFRVLGTVFARLPGIERVLVSGHHRVKVPDSGEFRARYLFSAKVTRESWEGIDFDRLARLDPAEALAAFPLRREMSRAGTFRDITPFELDWRWR